MKKRWVLFGLLLLSCLLLGFLVEISVPGVHCRLEGTLHRLPVSASPAAVQSVEQVNQWELEVGPGQRVRLQGANIASAAESAPLVRISAFAVRQDRMSPLEVTSCMPISARTPAASPPMRISQKPADRIHIASEVVTITGVRWGCDVAAISAETRHSWATATYALDRINQVYLVQKPFFPKRLFSHYLMLFTFKDGGIKSATGETSRGLVVSVEAYRQIGTSFSVLRGFQKHFAISWIMASFENYFSEGCTVEKETMFAQRVRATDEQKKSLFRAAMELGAYPRQGEFYHVITNSCITNQMIVLNKVFQEKIALWWVNDWLFNFRVAVPFLTIGYLRGLGILEAETITLTADTYSEKLP
jgi:hypothetical protein